MGIQGRRFYFHNEIPKVNTIKDKFEEITGLQLEYMPCLDLNQLVTDNEDFLILLEQSIKGDNAHIRRRPHFSCEDFDHVYLDDYMIPSSKSFYLICGIQIENMYFFNALSKTLLELGGNIFRYSIYPHEEDLNIAEYLEPYHPHDREWKQVKKWHEMNSVERAGFRSFYVKNRENGD